MCYRELTYQTKHEAVCYVGRQAGMKTTGYEMEYLTSSSSKHLEQSVLEENILLPQPFAKTTKSELISF